MNQENDFKIDVRETSRKDYFLVSFIYPNSAPIELTLERGEVRYLLTKLDNAI